MLTVASFFFYSLQVKKLLFKYFLVFCLIIKGAGSELETIDECSENESEISNTSTVFNRDIDTLSNPCDNESCGDEESENKILYVMILMSILQVVHFCIAVIHYYQV